MLSERAHLLLTSAHSFPMQVGTPRRARPSHRFSLLPRDLLQSLYAKQDALDAQQLLNSSPTKSSRIPNSPMPTSRLAIPEPQSSSEDEEDEQEREQENAPVQPAEEEVDNSEEESEQESELEEHEEKENVPVPSSSRRTTPAKVRATVESELWSARHPDPDFRVSCSSLPLLSSEGT